MAWLEVKLMKDEYQIVNTDDGNKVICSIPRKGKNQRAIAETFARSPRMVTAQKNAIGEAYVLRCCMEHTIEAAKQIMKHYEREGGEQETSALIRSRQRAAEFVSKLLLAACEFSLKESEELTSWRCFSIPFHTQQFE